MNNEKMSIDNALIQLEEGIKRLKIDKDAAEAISEGYMSNIIKNQTIIKDVYGILVNAQVHIEQGIRNGDTSASFLDTYISVAMEKLEESNIC